MENRAFSPKEVSKMFFGETQFPRDRICISEDYVVI